MGAFLWGCGSGSGFRDGDSGGPGEAVDRGVPPAEAQRSGGEEGKGDPAPPGAGGKGWRMEAPVPSRSSLHEVMVEAGFSPPEIRRMLDDAEPVYDLSRVRAGHRLLIERSPAGELELLEYDINDREFLRVTPGPEGRYQAEKATYDFQVRQARVEGVISSSLWNSVIGQGEARELVMRIANLFQWDVDFTLAQPGDSYNVLVEKLYKQGEWAGYGDILAGRYSSGGKDFYAFQYEHPERKKKIYYDADGAAVRKAFLKTPFAFDPRVTSGYTHRRFHPVHKVWRPHLGVDYGAPVGTPVLASASGRVVFAGRKGGFGKLVRVRHPNGYTTGYAHLSRILVKAGQSVEQGQSIGRVGATGVATGPHLDYRVQDRSGRYLNPRKMVSWPSDKPVEEHLRADFLEVRDRFMWRLAPVALQGCEVGLATD